MHNSKHKYVLIIGVHLEPAQSSYAQQLDSAQQSSGQ